MKALALTVIVTITIITGITLAGQAMNTATAYNTTHSAQHIK